MDTKKKLRTHNHTRVTQYCNWGTGQERQQQSAVTSSWGDRCHLADNWASGCWCHRETLCWEEQKREMPLGYWSGTSAQRGTLRSEPCRVVWWGCFPYPCRLSTLSVPVPSSHWGSHDTEDQDPWEFPFIGASTPVRAFTLMTSSPTTPSHHGWAFQHLGFKGYGHSAHRMQHIPTKMAECAFQLRAHTDFPKWTVLKWEGCLPPE